MKLVLAVLLASLPAPAQTRAAPAPFDPGIDTGFFPIAWSAEGNFAYGWYTESYAGPLSCQLSLAAQDLETDTLLWNFDKTWQQSPERGKRAPCPGTAAAAWKEASANALKKLGSIGITPSKTSPMRKFPIVLAEDQLTVELSRADQGYTVTAISRARGTKIIAAGLTSSCDQPSVEGYFLSPGEPRIAVLLKWSAELPFCPSYQVIGAHLRTGFTPAPK